VNNIPKNQYPDPSNYAGFLVWQKSNKWEKFINSKIKEIGLNQSELLHLISITHLLRTQQELSQSQLAEYTGVTTMSVSKILTKLERLSFVERKIGSDPRSKSIVVTEQGFVTLIQCAQLMHDSDVQFYPKSQKPNFIQYLSKL
jgi:DNA-binding MarR family transcriptional regulator